MNKLKELCHLLLTQKWFEFAIIVVILVNSVLIGIETYGTTPMMRDINFICLLIFTIEIGMRFFARESVRGFFSNGWNIFDLVLVLISYVPESIFADSSEFMALRVLRVFRVLRLLRVSNEIKVIIEVLVQSVSALFYNALFFFIFLYLFAITGVYLFQLPAYEQLSDENKGRYEHLQEDAYESAPDPYGDLSEGMFTLFRIVTGDDWAVIRYHLLSASEAGLISVSPAVITGYHIVWFVFAAFLLLNLVVGAIVNNYEMVMEKIQKKREIEDTIIEAISDGVLTNEEIQAILAAASTEGIKPAEAKLMLKAELEEKK
ncbi:MAG: ion transporter [Ignavibacteria bacterium]|nr:ion transporter [Ignavibacteria bacterium]